MPRVPNDKCKKISSDYHFDDLDRDLVLLDEMLRDSNIHIDDRLKIIKPITVKIPKTGWKTNKTEQAIVLHWLFRICLAIAFLLLSTVLVKHWQYFSWQLSAAGRIIMINMLPYFDWRYLKNENCLIPKLGNRMSNLILEPEIFDCDLCESLRDFDYIQVQANERVHPEFIKKFIDVDKPLVVGGEIEHWLTESPSDFIQQMLDEEEFSRAIPCNLCTNVHNSMRGEVDLKALFQKKSFFDGFFIHFQNCDLDAMRVFRNFTYRPACLSDEFSPVTYNWLLWNKNYNTMRYKKINLIEKQALIGQLFGSTRLRLIPRKNCQDVCPILEGILPAGYILIFTSLWDLEYLPEGTGDNMAAILEFKVVTLWHGMRFMCILYSRELMRTLEKYIKYFTAGDCQDLVNIMHQRMKYNGASNTPFHILLPIQSYPPLEFMELRFGVLVDEKTFKRLFWKATVKVSIAKTKLVYEPV